LNYEKVPKIRCWNRAQDLIPPIYQVTQKFPSEERYGITSQIRRASNSIAANFAEGCSRSSEPEFRRSLEISIGSVFEVISFLGTSKRLRYIEASQFAKLENDLLIIVRMLSVLHAKLKANGQWLIGA